MNSNNKGFTYGLVLLRSGIEYNLMEESYEKLKARLLEPSFDEDKGYINLTTRDGNDLVVSLDNIILACLSTSQTRQAAHHHMELMKKEDFEFGNTKPTYNPFIPE